MGAKPIFRIVNPSKVESKALSKEGVKPANHTNNSTTKIEKKSETFCPKNFVTIPASPAKKINAFLIGLEYVLDLRF